MCPQWLCQEKLPFRWVTLPCVPYGELQSFSHLPGPANICCRVPLPRVLEKWPSEAAFSWENQGVLSKPAVNFRLRAMQMWYIKHATLSFSVWPLYLDFKKLIISSKCRRKRKMCWFGRSSHVLFIMPFTKQVSFWNVLTTYPFLSTLLLISS